jgi:hypothetical protein
MFVYDTHCEKTDEKPSIMQGTTPTIRGKLPESVSLSGAKHLYATVSQEKVKIRKSGADVIIEDAHTVSFSLTQKDTLRLGTREDAKVQLNWTYPSGKRGATRIRYFKVEENTEKEELA